MYVNVLLVSNKAHLSVIIYPDHANALRKAGLAPPNFPTMGDLWRKQDEKVNMKKNKTSAKRKTEMSTFVLRTHVNFLRLSLG